MKEIIDIQLFDLGLAFLIMLIPISFFLYFRVKIVKSVLIALSRMILQLGLIAVYLDKIFELNSAYLNTAWVFLMISVGVTTAIKRVGLNWRYFVLPLFLSSLTAVLIIDSFFLGLVIKPDYFFDARYFVPITGMILGNSLNHNIVGLTTYFKGLKEKRELYFFILTNTGNSKLAIRPFINEAVKRGLNPMIATMTVIGLISLPGVMTGQILGGSSPVIAIKYQVMIMLAIFTGSTMNLFLSILFSNRFIFDKYNRLKKEVLK
ncbi:ABC transporter permease [Labilibacter marinus]|uniref:ABC transporter permease n=1 Tax=Labilibacter marinus TaxID=1477105 RepID=UPI00094F5701|nr:ABC transporter permease [Labilibacter marinus]